MACCVSAAHPQGEEWIPQKPVCLPGRNHEQAMPLRERLLEVVGKGLSAVAGAASASLDIHYGVVELEPDAYVEELIIQARRATYTVKI